MSVTCVLLEVLPLALGRSVTSLVAPLCAAVLGWGLLSQYPSLDTVSHLSLCRVWGQGEGSGTSSFGHCCQFSANKVGLDVTGSGRECQFEVKFRFLVFPLSILLAAEVSRVSLHVRPSFFLFLLESVMLAIRHQ